METTSFETLVSRKERILSKQTNESLSRAKKHKRKQSIIKTDEFSKMANNVFVFFEKLPTVLREKKSEKKKNKNKALLPSKILVTFFILLVVGSGIFFTYLPFIKQLMGI